MHDSRVPPAPEPAAPSRAPRILLVDDDAASRRLLAHALERLGFEVAAAADGDSALGLIESALPDVLLLDFEMPGLNGDEVCRRLRADERTEVRELPVIMLTGHASEADEIGCLTAGANDFITKPASRAVLEARIQTQLRLLALNRETRAQNEELARWQAAQEADLAAARATQQGLIFTSPPAMPGWAIETLYRPVIQVGGDVFGWRALGPDRWLFWLADATGHGAAAALFTTLAALLFHHACEEAQEPGAILECVNREFAEVFRGRSFMTACCLVLAADGRLSCASAGHPPILVRRQTGPVEAFGPHATIIGLPGPFAVTQSETVLLAGESVVLYSDGLFSLKNENGDRFAHFIVGEGLSAITPSAAPLGLLTGWLVARSNGEPFEDDVAAIALSRV